MKAIWIRQVIAESSNTIIVEGNHYFPPDSIHKEFFQDSLTKTVCSWKGEASYFSVKVGNDINKDAAWYYPSPKAEATNIQGKVAFWKGVEIKP